MKDCTLNVARGLAFLAAVITASIASAQSTESRARASDNPPPAPASEASKPKKVPSKKEVDDGAEKSAKNASGDDHDVFVLSPFEVTSDKDRGYRGGSTMSGTRMGADLDDIANPMTVVTKQQLSDFAAHDINDIFATELSVEGTRTYTANSNDGKGDVDAVSLNPETANRVRGLGAANISIGNFGASSTIPIDTYNVDAVEISRGPNSSIFGMGEASGTVNLVQAAANLTRDSSKTTLSYSSFGSKRGTVDLNRMIFKNKLALRVNALDEHKGFEREPSFDRTRRYQVSLTAQPFKYTTIRASYENFRERFSRPNSMTATDYVSIWNQVGRPSWNPFTSTWSYNAYTNPVNGVSYAGASGVINPTSGNDANQYLNGTGAVPANAAPPAGALWLAGFTSTRVRPVMFIDQGQVQWAGTEYWTANGTTNRHELLALALPTNYNVPAIYQGTLTYRAVPASTDKSFYDYESLSLAGLNRGAKDAETTRIELEQIFLNTPTHLLAAQFGFFKEHIMEVSRNFVGNGGDGVALNILPDVNLTLPDGTPNPYYGAPYMSALAPQTYTKPVNTKTYRLNLVYQLDLTKQKTLFRFLGKTKVLGYAEDFDKVYAKNSLRYQDQVVDVLSPWYVNSIRNNNNGKFLTRYYVGDKSGNVDYGSQAPENSQITYRRYGSQAATATLPAESPMGWYSLNNVNLAPAYFSQGKQNIQTTTQGFILQNYLVNDRIITTWGRRRDTLRTRETATGDLTRSLPEPASAIDPNSGLSTSLGWLDDFSGSPWNIVDKTTGAKKSIGFTDNKGIVIKPFRWLNLRYNQSTSFKPEDFAIDFQGDPLPNSGGKSKDYGFVVNLFSNKLNIGLTRYETFAKNSRDNNIVTVARRIINLDYDPTLSGTQSNFDIEDWYYTELLTSQGLVDGSSTPTLTQATDQQRADALTATHAKMGLTDARIAYTRLYTPGMTADRRANGYELSIDYNPTPYFSIKFNGSRGETVYTNYGKTWTDYRNERMPIWTTITSPVTGLRWWDQVTFSGVTPKQNWLALNEAPMKVNLALDGKPVPQNAKYKFNFLTRYRLAGLFPTMAYVKNVTLGGRLSWIDKTGIGFYGAEPVLVPSDANPSQLVLKTIEYNADRPIWYKAQTYVDVFATYDFHLMQNRIRGNLQLNVRNVNENGHLQPYAVNPDGQFYNYRIVDPREYIVSVSFDL